MTRAAELEHLRHVAAYIDAKVEPDGEGVVLLKDGLQPLRLPSLTAAGLVIGGLFAMSPAVNAAVTVSGARYGLSPGANRAQRRAGRAGR